MISHPNSRPITSSELVRERVSSPDKKREIRQAIIKRMKSKFKMDTPREEEVSGVITTEVD
jgi:hypothetical protein